MRMLHLKHLIVDTPLAGLFQRVRWVAAAPRRARHPELWDVFMEGKRTTVAIDSLIEVDHNCVDVGAHIGSVLAEMRRRAPHGSHVAFEPVPVKAGWLRKKFDDVEIIEAATSDAAGTAMFHDNLDEPGFSGLGAQDDSSDVSHYEVDLVRLDDHLADRDHVDFIKIDVEGSELPTLRGAADTISAHRPTILFESGTNAQLEPFGYTRTDLFGFFAERDYDVYSVVDFVYGCAPMTADVFDRWGTFPFRGFNYFAVPAGTEVPRLL